MAQIHEAIAGIMGDVDAIGKTRKNTQQGYTFRGIDDVYFSVHPLFVKHGVFSVPRVVAERSEDRVTKSGSSLIYRVLTIEYTFFSKDGSSVQATVIGEGMDSGDKASNKAMSVGHKYAILQMLAIPTDEPKDPEIDSPEVAPKQSTPELGEIRAIVSRLGMDEMDKAKLRDEYGTDYPRLLAYLRAVEAKDAAATLARAGIKLDSALK